MRCLLVSDLHYTLKQFDWLDAVAHEYDLVVLAGDHLDVSSLVALDAQIVVILKYLRRLMEKTRVLVSSGNHDLNGRSSAGEKIARWMSRVRQLGIAADGDRVEIGDLSFTICPWWDGPHTRDQVDAQLAADAQRRARRWVWIYHAPPAGSALSWDGRQHHGDAELTEWIRRYRPDMVLAGHIHQAPFRGGGCWVERLGDTWLFNAGRQIGPVPTHVVLDLSARRASWFSLAGDQFIALDEASAKPTEVPQAQ
jgi:Icc-related predicted phosphoesterase